MPKTKISMSLYEVRLSITGACNHNCFYCGPFSDGKIDNGYKNLLLKQVKKITPLLKELDIHVQITGGEPTLRNNLIDIVKTLKKGGIDDIGMSTNGSNMNPKYAKSLVDAGISDIHIHFPSLDQDIFSKTTGDKQKGVVKRILKTVDSLKNLGCGVELNTPITALNKEKTAELMGYCYENKINLKLIEIVSSSDKKIEEDEIRDLLKSWVHKKSLSLNKVKVKNKYGIVYDFGGFFFRIAPETEGLLDFLEGRSDEVLYDGRYWIGGNGGKFLFSPTCFLPPQKGNFNDFEKNIKETIKKYQNEKK